MKRPSQSQVTRAGEQLCNDVQTTQSVLTYSVHYLDVFLLCSKRLWRKSKQENSQISRRRPSTSKCLRFRKGKCSEYELWQLLLLHQLKAKLALPTQAKTSIIQKSSGCFWTRKDFHQGLLRRGIWKNQAGSICRRHKSFPCRDMLLCDVCSCGYTHAGMSES